MTHVYQIDNMKLVKITTKIKKKFQKIGIGVFSCCFFKLNLLFKKDESIV